MTSRTAKENSRLEKPRSSLRRAGHFTWSCACCGFWVTRWAARIAATLFALALGVVLYLNLVGFPDALTRRWLNELRERGYYLDVKKLRFDLFAGISADDVKVFERSSSVEPFLTASRLSVDVRLAKWLRRQPSPFYFRVDGGYLRLRTERELNPARLEHILALEKVHARMSLTEAGMDLDEVSALFLGVAISGRGRLVGAPRDPSKPAQNPVEMLSRLLKRRPGWLPGLAEQLNAIRFDRPPEAMVDFNIDLARPESAEANLTLSSQAVHTRGITFDEWRVEAGFKDGRARFPVFILREGRRQASLSGYYDFLTTELSARLFSDLPPSRWFRLIPAAWAARVAREGYLFDDPLACEVWLGPAPAKEALDTVSGWMSLRRANLRGIWVEKGFASFKRSTNSLHVTKIDAILGRGAHQGALLARATFDFETQLYSGHAAASFDPNVLQPIFNARQSEIVGWFAFDRCPPVGVVDYSGHSGFPNEFAVTGFASASNFTCRGEAIRYLETPFVIANGLMTLDTALMIRPEGRCEGLVVQDFNANTVDVSVTNTADPRAIARMLGPAADRFMRQFRIEGPVRLAAKGKVDYHTGARTDISVEAQAERLGILKLLADRVVFNLRVIGRRSELTAISGSLCGGLFSGHAAFFPVGSDTNIRYEISAKAQDANFGALADMLRPKKPAEPKEGTVSGWVEVAGFIGKGRGDTAVGKGQIEVSEGNLFKLSLFLGLSEFLSRLFPGFGYFTQSDFFASFDIADRKVRTQDASLEGAMVSIVGDGEYEFNESLDFKVQVRLLRGGPLAYMLNLMTFPVTKLLEFRLIGTLDEPKWRPVNFPKELFLIFD